MLNRRLSRTFYWSFLALLLSGCHDASPPTPKVDTAAIWHQGKGFKLLKQEKQQVLVLSANEYFEPNSVQLRKSQAARLKQVSQYVKNIMSAHPNTQVLLTGYPLQSQHNTGLGLSHQYAVVMASEFWGKGLAVRVVDQIHNLSERELISHALRNHQHGVVIRIIQ